MEVPEWVRVVSHGTCEELREFIRANPGFDWDRTRWNGASAIWYAWRFHAFYVGALDVLYHEGGAHFEEACCRAMTLMDVAAIHGDTALATTLMLRYGVDTNNAVYLHHDANVREVILEHSTTLTKDTVKSALIAFDNDRRHKGLGPTPESNAVRSSMYRWLVSHNYRRDASLSVAWTLSQLTGTLWPDTREQLLERLMATRVREW